MNSRAHSTSSTVQYTIQYEHPEPGSASMRSEQLEVNVKICSGIETLPTRTTNCNVHNNHQKLTVTIDKGQKPGHLCKIKNPPDTILKPEKKDTSAKTQMYANPELYIMLNTCLETYKKYVHFGSWFYSCLQVSSCHYTNGFGTEPRTF
jgi:hypothetical protein